MINLVKKVFKKLRWDLAHRHLSSLRGVDVIGIAGSVGKTTTKEIIATVLSQKFKTVKTPKNWDPIFNLPITALKVVNNTKFVAELGIDGVGQMDKYLTLVKPKVAVITRLMLEHTDAEHLGSLETAIEEELKLLKALPQEGYAILNGDDTNVRKAIVNSSIKNILFGFGLDNDCVISNFSQNIDSTEVHVQFDINYEGSTSTYRTNLLGKHNAMCSCAAISVGYVYGMESKEIQKGLDLVEPIEGRMTPKKGKWGLVIDDTYNASPVAVKSAIDTLVELDPQSNTLVLGDMLELGDYKKDAHYEIGVYARDKGIKHLAVYGSAVEYTLRGFGKEEKSFKGSDHSEIIEWLEQLNKGVVLVKGSRSMKMEEVVKGITN